MKERKYSLFTAICMITGIVIGSGIFFKADDILHYTNGNMLLGILVFIIASIAIVFGSLTISQLAMRTDRRGGIIAYAKEFMNKDIACAFGWFQLFVYFPTLISIVSEVASIYLCQLFSMNPSLELKTCIAIVISIAVFGMNIFSAKIGGYIQNATMIIKLIPLLVIALLGIFLGNPGEIVQTDVMHFGSTAKSFTWIAAFAPIAFSFDGWTVSTTLSHEIKNSKKNLPIALTVAPILILFVYIAYYVGITSLLGTESVLAHGDSSVYIAATQLFGSLGAKLVLIFIVISVLGTMNGLSLAFIRMPYTLASGNMFPFKKVLCKSQDEEASFSVASGVLSFLVVLLWTVFNYGIQKFNISADISEVSICLSYLIYTLLYFTVIRLAKCGEVKGIWKGYLNPVFAIIGSIIIFSGTLTNPLFEAAMIIFCGIMIGGYFYSKKTKQ